MPGAKSSGHRAQTLSSPGSSSDGSGQADPCAPLPSARHLSPPYARARMLLGGHYPCPVAELPPTPSFSPLVPPPCALPSDPRQDSQCVSVCVCTLSHVPSWRHPEESAPHGKGWAGVLQDLRGSHPRVSPMGGLRLAGEAGTIPAPLDSAHLPAPGRPCLFRPRDGLDADLHQPSSARTPPGSPLWTMWGGLAQGRTGLPPAWLPGLTFTAGRAHKTQDAACT